MNWLSGKKTYIGIVAGALVAVLYEFGVIDEQIAKTAGLIVLTWTGVSVRLAITKSGQTALIALLVLGLSGCAQTSWGPYGAGHNVGAAVGTYIKVRGGMEPGLEVQTGADQIADANYVEVKIGDKTLIMKGVHFANSSSEVRRAAAVQAEKVPPILDAQGRVVESVGNVLVKVVDAGGRVIGTYYTSAASAQTQVIGARANAAVSIIDATSNVLADRIKARLEQAVQEEADRILPEPTTQPTVQP